MGQGFLNKFLSHSVLFMDAIIVFMESFSIYENFVGGAPLNLGQCRSLGHYIGWFGWSYKFLTGFKLVLGLLNFCKLGSNSVQTRLKFGLNFFCLSLNVCERPLIQTLLIRSYATCKEKAGQDSLPARFLFFDTVPEKTIQNTMGALRLHNIYSHVWLQNKHHQWGESHGIVLSPVTYFHQKSDSP